MKYTKIIPGYKTDHSAIIFTFATSLAKRGKGYWKFNSQLLRDTDYIKRVKTCITAPQAILVSDWSISKISSVKRKITLV
jgi:hypothetical protein